MKTIVRITVFGLLAGMVLGCLPVSISPISQPDPSATDMGLLGTWFWKEKEESGYVHIGLLGDTGELSVIMVDFKDGAFKKDEYTVHTSRLGDATYLNVRMENPDTGEVYYYFMKYRIMDKNYLELAHMNLTFVEDSIRLGRVRGEMRPGGAFGDDLITATSREISCFLINHEDEIFNGFESTPLVKIDPSSFGERLP